MIKPTFGSLFSKRKKRKKKYNNKKIELKGKKKGEQALMFLKIQVDR